MTCLEFSQIARDYARQAWISAPVQAEAARHLESCGGCRERLEQERELDGGLADWGDAERSLQPGAALGAAVLAEFDRAQGPVRRRAVRPAVAWGALAAALCAAAVGLAWLRTDTPERRNAPVAAVSPAIPHPAVVASEVPHEIAALPRSTAAARRVRPPAARERVTAFLPIGSQGAMDPREDLRLLRIQLPESELLRLGLPVAPRLEQGYVRADVLLGEDGLARAIRFVY
ncbi:MAG: hypothetical protein JNK87_00475 [Bryobacterales bacterium]|nr:hypothetical protein [Bryobacterales bacterium]